MPSRFTILARSSTGLFDIPLGHAPTLNDAAHMVDKPSRAYHRERFTDSDLIIIERERAYPFRTIRRWNIEHRQDDLGRAETVLIEVNP